MSVEDTYGLNLNANYLPIYDEELNVVSGENIAYFYIENTPTSMMKNLDGSTNINAYGRYYLKSGQFPINKEG